MLDRIVQAHPLAGHPILFVIHALSLVWTALLPWLMHHAVAIWAQVNPSTSYPAAMNFWGAFAAIVGVLAPLLFVWLKGEADRKERHENLEGELTKLRKENTTLQTRVGSVEHRSGELRVDVNANRTTMMGQHGELEAVTQSLREANFFSPPPPISSRGAEPTLVIVEDDEALLAKLSKWFTLRGFAVTPAGSVAHGITAVSKGAHWAIVDIKVAGGNGFDILRHIRTHNLNTKVIIAAGVIDDGARKEAEELHTRWLFTKPIDPDILYNTMVEHAYD